MRRANPVLVLVVLALTALPATASAAKSCGVERAISEGRVFKVKAVRAKCKTAKDVAGGWYNVTSAGKSGKVVYDNHRPVRRRWGCRITERATGTDPGYTPYTSVRCSRKKKVVTFKLRS